MKGARKPALVIAIFLLFAGLPQAGVLAQEEETTRPRDDSEIIPKKMRDQADIGTRAVLDMLTRKEQALDRREATLNDREADLRVAEQELTQRLEDLKTLREELTKLLVKADDDREQRVEQLKAMFEGMRSGDAANILANTDTDVALEVLQRMSRTKAGKVLASMKPADAAALAERMAAKPLSNLETNEEE